MNLVAVGGGRLGITHRPKKGSLEELRAAGVTHLVTLLSEREGAAEIGAEAKAAGLGWIWIPLDGGAVPKLERTAALRPAIEGLRDALAGGATLVVHCSAGIHRTGMIANAVLRCAGLGVEAARAALREMREVTADDVGKPRLAWGDALVEAGEKPADPGV